MAEDLLRYCARPAFPLARLRKIDAEHLVYESVKPGCGGSISLMLTALELIERLAVLIPPPHRHRHRCYWVLAPNALLQSQLRPVSAVEHSPKRSNLGLPRRLLMAGCRKTLSYTHLLLSGS